MPKLVFTPPASYDQDNVAAVPTCEIRQDEYVLLVLVQTQGIIA